MTSKIPIEFIPGIREKKFTADEKQKILDYIEDKFNNLKNDILAKNGSFRVARNSNGRLMIVADCNNIETLNKMQSRIDEIRGEFSHL